MVAAMPTRPMPSALFCSDAMDGGAWRSAALSSIMLRGSFGRVVLRGAFGRRVGRMRLGLAQAGRGLAGLRLGAGLAALEPPALGRRQVADAGVLAELKGADVG